VVFKFFWKIASSGDARSTPAWLQDPLNHPDVRAMSLRELADLPLPAEGPPAATSEKHKRAMLSSPARLESRICQLANRPASAP
jgi:hypothetical protein